jgi:hypothetical protein
MTGIAIRRRGLENTFGVTLLAAGGDMPAGQPERRLVVIERRGRPGHRVVARDTIVRELSGRMTGSLCRIVVVAVTIEASGRCRHEVSLNVALLAGRGDVSPGQGKRCGGVIERRGLPGDLGMARGTIASQLARCVVGGTRAGIIGLMTGIAVLRRAAELPVHMALLTTDRRVSADQLEIGLSVIEGRRSPYGRRVTGSAFPGKLSGSVTGTLG